MSRAYTVNTDPIGLGDDVSAEIIVGHGSADGMIAGVTLDWRRNGRDKPAMRIEAFDDTFHVLADLAPFFAWLSRRKGPTSLAQARTALKKQGFVEVPLD